MASLEKLKPKKSMKKETEVLIGLVDEVLEGSCRIVRVTAVALRVQVSFQLPGTDDWRTVTFEVKPSLKPGRDLDVSVGKNW